MQSTERPHQICSFLPSNLKRAAPAIFLLKRQTCALAGARLARAGIGAHSVDLQERVSGALYSDLVRETGDR